MKKYNNYRKGSWEIKVVPCGYMNTPKGILAEGFDEDLRLDLPYQAFLLQNGYTNILVDNGMNEANFPYGLDDGTTKYFSTSADLLASLEKLGLTPGDVDLIIYTHLHADHAGNAKLFPDTRTVLQKDEWLGCLHLCHREKLFELFDPVTIPALQQNPNLLLVDGDLELMEGITLYKVPGHTRGSQALAIDSVRGFRLMAGDLFHLPINLFPWMEELMDIHGVLHKVTPLEDWPVMPSGLVMNYYDFYESAEKIKALLPGPDPQYVICGHDASLMFRDI